MEYQSIYSKFLSPTYLLANVQVLTKSNVRDYINSELRSLSSEFQTNLSLSYYQDFDTDHTFIDGIELHTGLRLWCLPTYPYELYINKDTKILSETVGTVVRNGLILYETNRPNIPGSMNYRIRIVFSDVYRQVLQKRKRT